MLPQQAFRIPYAMLYYPEELRVGVLGHSLRQLWRWGIKRLSVNTRLAFR